MPFDAAAWKLVVRAAWHRSPVPSPPDDVLARGLVLARRNDVAPLVVRAYADRLPAAVAEVERAVGAYRRNLEAACALLRDAGVEPILIKALPEEDYVYSNFDIVVGDDGWDAAVRALQEWAVSSSRYPLERGTKLLLYPPEGPAVHLHREVAWFDIPAVPTEALRSGAVASAACGCLLPRPAVALRILVAHAVFQNLALSLGDLITYRDLATGGHAREAAEAARREGWQRGYFAATRVARRTIERLDALGPLPLPVALPVASSLVGGVEHAAHLAGHGKPLAAARELLLRAPLVAAKRRRSRASGRGDR